MAKSKLHPLAKQLGYKSNAAFYKDYPTEDSFKQGGAFKGRKGPFPQIQNDQEFFSRGYANIKSPYNGSSLQYGGSMFPIPSPDQSGGQGSSESLYRGNYPEGYQWQYRGHQGDTLGSTLTKGDRWGLTQSGDPGLGFFDKSDIADSTQYGQENFNSNISNEVDRMNKIAIRKGVGISKQKFGGFPQVHAFPTQPTLKGISDYGYPTPQIPIAQEGATFGSNMKRGIKSMLPSKKNTDLIKYGAGSMFDMDNSGQDYNSIMGSAPQSGADYQFPKAAGYTNSIKKGPASYPGGMYDIPQNSLPGDQPRRMPMIGGSDDRGDYNKSGLEPTGYFRPDQTGTGSYITGEYGGAYNGMFQEDMELPEFNYGSNYMRMGGTPCKKCGGSHMEDGGFPLINEGSNALPEGLARFTNGIKEGAFNVIQNEEMEKLAPMFKKGGSKDWISGAVNPAHKGYCTPMSKSTCTPSRKAFARRAKAGFKEYGGITEYGPGGTNPWLAKGYTPTDPLATAPSSYYRPGEGANTPNVQTFNPRDANTVDPLYTSPAPAPGGYQIDDPRVQRKVAANQGFDTFSNYVGSGQDPALTDKFPQYAPTAQVIQKYGGDLPMAKYGDNNWDYDSGYKKRQDLRSKVKGHMGEGYKSNWNDEEIYNHALRSGIIKEGTTQDNAGYDPYGVNPYGNRMQGSGFGNPYGGYAWKTKNKFYGQPGLGAYRSKGTSDADYNKQLSQNFKDQGLNFYQDVKPNALGSIFGMGPRVRTYLGSGDNPFVGGRGKRNPDGTIVGNKLRKLFGPKGEASSPMPGSPSTTGNSSYEESPIDGMSMEEFKNNFPGYGRGTETPAIAAADDAQYMEDQNAAFTQGTEINPMTGEPLPPNVYDYSQAPPQAAPPIPFTPDPKLPGFIQENVTPFSAAPTQIQDPEAFQRWRDRSQDPSRATGFRQEGGDYNEGDELELTPAEIKKLKAMGYQFDIIK